MKNIFKSLIIIFALWTSAAAAMNGPLRTANELLSGNEASPFSAQLRKCCSQLRLWKKHVGTPLQTPEETIQCITAFWANLTPAAKLKIFGTALANDYALVIEALVAEGSYDLNKNYKASTDPKSHKVLAYVGRFNRKNIACVFLRSPVIRPQLGITLCAAQTIHPKLAQFLREAGIQGA